MTIKATFRHIEVSKSDVSVIDVLSALSKKDEKNLPELIEVIGEKDVTYQMVITERNEILFGMLVRKSKENTVDTIDDLLNRHHYKLNIGTLYSFNFFSISKKTLHGLYHEQPDGASLAVLTKIIRLKALDMLELQRQNYLEEITTKDKNIDPEKAEKLAMKKFKRPPKINPVYTPAEFRDIVAALSGVTSFKHRMRVVKIPDGALSVRPKTEWRSFKYGGSGIVSGLGGSVASYIIDRTRSDRASVTGIDAAGEKIVVQYGRKVREMISSMHAVEFKKMWPLKSSEFQECQAVDHLERIMNKNQARFGLTVGMDSDEGDTDE